MSEFNTVSGHIPIESSRRLIPGGYEAYHGLEEYYDPQISSRVITMPVLGEQARSHEELTEQRLPVFSALYRGHELCLLVPEGSRPLKGLLRFIARDVRNYEEIFYKVGQALGQLDASGMGLPEASPKHSLLDSFAFSLDDDDIYGGTVYMTPPYSLNPMKRIDQELSGLFLELTSSQLFSEIEVVDLIAKTHKGWQDESRT